MRSCPVQKLARKYDPLAKRWRDHEDDDAYEKMAKMVCSAERLKPKSVTGATFLLACAIEEMGFIVQDDDDIRRLASERRVLELLQRAFLCLQKHSDELPAVWQNMVLPGDDHLRQRYAAE